MQQTVDEVKRLQSYINDLISVQALAAIWSGSESESRQMAGTLLEALVAILRLDFACARLNGSTDGSPIEVVRLAQRRNPCVEPEEVTAALSRWLNGGQAVSGFVIPNPAGEGEVAIASSPLGLHDEIGVVLAGSRRTDFPTQFELLLLRVAANQAAIGLQEARRSDEQKRVAEALERRVTERTGQLTAVNEELRRSQEYLAKAQRLSQTGSFGWKISTGELLWSEETFRIFQYDGTTKPTVELALERVHPEDAAHVKQTIERASQDGNGFDFEHRLLMHDGSIKHVHVVAHAAQDSTGNLTFIGAVTDITAAKQTEEALRTSEQQWRDVFENNPTMYFMVDAEGVIMAVNPFGAGQLGYTVNELVGQPMLSVFYEPDREEVQRNFALCLLVLVIEGARGPEKQPGHSMSWEVRKVRKDGSVLWVRETARAVLRANDRVVLIAGEDITERRSAEEKIKQQELELRQVLDLAPQHVAVLGPDRDRLYVNRAVLEYHGVTLEEWHGSGPRRFFHPDDWERIRSEHQSKGSIGSPYETEARLLRSDGTYRWFLMRYNPLRDEQGQVIRWYIASTDIEDRRQAEQRLQNENIALREEIDKASMFEEIVGTSAALQNVLSRLCKVAPTDSSVLITGETGTGKELVARAIHRRSRRSSRAFVSVNCAAIPRDLIASELFGHEKGAFTGATQRHLGRFELAEGGTIFLDEVGELPVETQIALLRVLQEHEFDRVGGNRSIRTDVRVIAATNRDLESAISVGTFRRDLFYRLNVFPIEVPPLRERKEDIPLLVEYFIDRFARKAGKGFKGVNTNSLNLLQSYPWPGNIRELQNVIERSVIVCETENFSVDESWLSRPRSAAEPAGPVEFSERLAAQEKEIIEAALSECGGRVFGPSGAAARLGMPRSTLESKIRSLKINKNRFKT
jgi:PAS domain S-box-containing protein